MLAFRKGLKEKSMSKTGQEMLTKLSSTKFQAEIIISNIINIFTAFSIQFKLLSCHVKLSSFYGKHDILLSNSKPLSRSVYFCKY